MFSWPKGPSGRLASTKTFDVGGTKKELTAAGVKDASPTKLCVPFQFMYALSSNFADDDKRLDYAHRFCSNTGSKHHDSATAGTHEQLPGLDRPLLLRHES